MHTLKVRKDLYSLAVIKSAAYAFLDKAYIVLDADEENYHIILHPKDNQSNLELRFHDMLITYANFHVQQEKQGEIIKKIIERALFSTSPALIQEAEEEEINQLLKELEQDDDPQMQQVLNDWKNDNKGQ